MSQVGPSLQTEQAVSGLDEHLLEVKKKEKSISHNFVKDADHGKWTQKLNKTKEEKCPTGKRKCNVFCRDLFKSFTMRPLSAFFKDFFYIKHLKIFALK